MIKEILFELRRKKEQEEEEYFSGFDAGSYDFRL